MGITPKDIAAQRAMIARGEALAAVKNHHAERARLRDTFAAAALTGLLAADGDRTEHAMPNFTARAYEWADAMLLQRNGAVEGCEAVLCNASVGVPEMDSGTDRKPVATPRACARPCSQPFDSAPTTHDAVPEAKATNDGGTPKDADGTGNTSSPESYDKSDEKRTNTTMSWAIDKMAYEGDIVSRLKNWRGLHLAHGGMLFEEAAGEIERLRLELSVQKACTVAGREEIARLRDLVAGLGAAIETAGYIYRNTDSGPNLVRP
jgi:hypothetical protein